MNLSGLCCEARQPRWERGGWALGGITGAGLWVTKGKCGPDVAVRVARRPSEVKSMRNVTRIQILPSIPPKFKTCYYYFSLVTHTSSSPHSILSNQMKLSTLQKLKLKLNFKGSKSKLQQLHSNRVIITNNNKLNPR
ncbi:hypothetical protein VNO78_00275 [Psophocarpus tetragonolobus]|uniref:Uncharacterized protein n=1 Tax=Psophocarpus tetragonolobus TaxID=3891 RepID=A0AAN9XUI3_PSOTE